MLITNLSVVAQMNFYDPHVLPGSDSCTVIYSNNLETKLEASGYTILLNSHAPLVGESIKIMGDMWGDTLILSGGAIYFFGISKDYLFIDQGTSPERNLTIIKMPFNFINSFDYIGGVRLKSDSIFYQYLFGDKEKLPQHLPKCSDTRWSELGYTEKRIFILNTKETIKTGDIQCYYRQ